MISSLICSALRGEELRIYGDGRQTRSFCYIDDMVEGIVRLMESGDDFLGPVNLGSTQEHTIQEIAEMVLRLTGAKSRTVHEARPEDDPMRRLPLTELARERLGWEPHVPIEKGLEETVGYFKKRIEAP